MKHTKPKKASQAKKASSEGHRPFQALRELKARIEKEGEGKPAAAARTPPKPPPVPEDEALTMHRMMSGVTPLATPARRIPRSADTLPKSAILEHRARSEKAAELEATEVHEHLRALIDGGRFEVEDDGHRVEGRRAGVPHELLRKLRRGLFPIDARLDLHGKRAEEARDVVARFLGEKRAKGERCVLVVHGKGEHSPRGQGILRGEMAAWLSQGSASVHVAAFATAEPEDGGEGATYVLLVR
jgi:DNA-nicking Smr family endonuclease